MERGQGPTNNCPKQGREEDVEVSKDKPSDSSREDFEQHAPKRRAEGGESSRDKGKEPAVRDFVVKPTSWLREGFQVSVVQRELMSLAIGLYKSAPVLSGLHLSDPRVGRFLGGDALQRCIDFDTLK